MDAWGKCHFFGADMKSSAHVDDKNKDVLILGQGTAQGLDDTTLTAEAVCPINFTQPNKRFVFSLHYNGRNKNISVQSKKLWKKRLCIVLS